MRIKTWIAALAAITLVAPACSENEVMAPNAVAFTPRSLHSLGVRINEFHYDNIGDDVGEFVEVSGPAGTDLTGWQILLYNGSGGAVYRTDVLTGTIPDQCAGRGVRVVTYSNPPAGLLQNGAPDGIALVGPAPENHVVEFISYEGTFQATTGPAAATTPPMTSTSVGQTEGSATPVGHSIARSETNPSVWNAAAPNTMGACNEAPPPPPPPPVVIPETRFNEIHYDNVGTDGNEKIEISGPAGTDLSGWSVVLYNGAVGSGAPYHTTSLAGTIPSMCDGRGVVVVSYPQDGIQNGAPDGFALVNSTGQVVEFLSYEGAFTATAGPAAGTTSTDIGESEPNSSPIGHSLQRSANGQVWRETPLDQPAARPATFGLCNNSTAPPLSGVVTFTGRTVFEDPPLPVGFEDQLFGTERDPSNTVVTTTFAWTSETPSIASIDEDGVMRALAPGTAILRATAADGTTGTYALPTRVATASATAIYDGNAEFGEPRDNDASDDFIVRRDQLISSFNKNRGTPNWVAYEIEASHFGNELRCDCFTFDPALPADFAPYTTADYTGAGAFHGYAIDRGHLARSADRDAGSLDNAITYYFTNIIPQAADNNQGPWADLENYLGNLASAQNKEVYIIAGVAGSLGTVKDEGKITIPENVWKVAVIMPRDHGIEHIDDLSDFEIVAVIMPNIEGIANVDWEDYKTTINNVEALSGYDLLALLNNEIEIAVESGLRDGFLQVRQLVTGGTIKSGDGKWIENKLDNAAKHLDRGQIRPSVNQLEHILNRLDQLVKSGDVTEADVSALRAVVTGVIASVSS